MFDNLREQANSTPFYEDEAQFRDTAGIGSPPRRGSAGGRLMGTTPIQRFILAVMLFMAICALGAMCLLITGKIGLM